MGVDEMIARLPELDAAELRRLKEAVELAVSSTAETDEERWRRGDELLDRLRRGLGTSGGKHLSANIDEALYGRER